MVTRDDEPRERSWPAHTLSLFGDGSCRRCRLDQALWASRSCRVIAHQPVGDCWLCHADGGGSCRVAGLRRQWRGLLTPLEARRLCEAKVGVILASLSDPAEQALLYRELQRLDWNESRVARVLEAEGWDRG